MAKNVITGKELDIKNFIMACMDGLNAEANDANLMKIHLDYLKSFIDTFDPNEINPFLTTIQKNYVIANRPIDIGLLKKQHEDEFQNGTRTEDMVYYDLPKWPSGLINPHIQKAIFGTTSQSSGSKKKGISSMPISKLDLRIKNIKSADDILYLIEYFIVFYFQKEKVDVSYYDKFLEKLKNFGYKECSKENAFQVKTIDNIYLDIIGVFLFEDMKEENNQVFLINCIKRYYELFS